MSRVPQPLHPQLAAVVADYQRASERIHRLADAVTPDRWSLRNNQDAWSVAECIAHLNLTSEAYLPVLRKALAKSPPLDNGRRLRRNLMGWLIGAMSGPMPRFGGKRIGRVRTTASFVPSGNMPRDPLLAKFDALQRQQVELVMSANGRAVDRVQIQSPFDSRVSYNLWSAFVLLPRHQHRHIDQAEEVWQAS